MDEPQPLSREDHERLWRLECFLALGFGIEPAEELALARADHHDARKMLDRGATHRDVFDILR